jgi:hypothetical protein
MQGGQRSRHPISRFAGSPESGRCPGDVSGSLRTGADDERRWEVGRTHTAGEVSERSQNIGFSRISQPGTPAQNLVQTRLEDETTVTENLHLAWESRP